LSETPQPPEPTLDPEVVGKEQPRAGKSDSRPQVLQELVASFARSSGPAYHPIFEKALGIFGAGAAGGYGLRAYQDRRPDQPRDS
jgi:hypothetical protein